MTTQQESLRILRRAGDLRDGQINLGECALALAALDKQTISLASYREHLAILCAQAKEIGPAKKLEDQLAVLRQVLVVQNKYQGDPNHAEDARATNLMDVIDRRQGAPIMLGLLYLHIAAELGWAMAGLDLSGHFLLRLSAQDGQAIIDPYRAGQTCQIEAAPAMEMGQDMDLGLDTDPDQRQLIDPSSEILRPFNRRELLLRLQHGIKRRFLSQDRVELAIATLQSMILFAPRNQELWRELGYLQAERGHIRAAITALEVVRDLIVDPTPLQQANNVIKELRWRLN